jgi:hypothetical protein
MRLRARYLLLVFLGSTWAAVELGKLGQAKGIYPLEIIGAGLVFVAAGAGLTLAIVLGRRTGACFDRLFRGR